jgi:hypothetical protein
MAGARLLFPIGLAAAPVVLVACSSVWGFDTLVAGDAASGDALADDATSVDAPQDGTSHDGLSVQDGPATDGSGEHDGSPVDATAHDAPDDAPSDTGGDAPAVCTGTCAPAAPSGWSGPLEVSFSATAPPTCGGAWGGTNWISYDTLDAPAATCGCSCDAPTGTVCSAEYQPDCISGGICSYGCSGNVALTAGQCSGAIGSAGGQAVAGGGIVTAGTCAPQATVNKPATSWADEARACAPTTTPAACEGAAVCVPAVDPTFAICVEQSGDVACPPAYPNQHLEYSGLSDTRGCSACTCGAPSGASCGGGINCYADGACGSYLTSTGGGCDQSCPYVRYDQQLSGGSCGAASVSPTGSATPTGATTFCCQ